MSKSTLAAWLTPDVLILSVALTFFCGLVALYFLARTANAPDNSAPTTKARLTRAKGRAGNNAPEAADDANLIPSEPVAAPAAPAAPLEEPKLSKKAKKKAFEAQKKVEQAAEEAVKKAEKAAEDSLKAKQAAAEHASKAEKARLEKDAAKLKRDMEEAKAAKARQQKKEKEEREEAERVAAVKALKLKEDAAKREREAQEKRAAEQLAEQLRLKKEEEDRVEAERQRVEAIKKMREESQRSAVQPLLAVVCAPACADAPGADWPDRDTRPYDPPLGDSQVSEVHSFFSTDGGKNRPGSLLGAQKFDVIACSPFRSSLSTAGMLAKAFKITRPIIVHRGLGESMGEIRRLCGGRLSGLYDVTSLSKSEMQTAIGGHVMDPTVQGKPTPKGEAEPESRMARTIAELRSQHAGSNLLIVGHDCTVASMVTNLKKTETAAPPGQWMVVDAQDRLIWSGGQTCYLTKD